MNGSERIEKERKIKKNYVIRLYSLQLKCKALYGYIFDIISEVQMLIRVYFDIAYLKLKTYCWKYCSKIIFNDE